MLKYFICTDWNSNIGHTPNSFCAHPKSRKSFFTICLCDLGFKKEYKSLQMASKKVYFLTVWAAQNKEDLEGLARVVDIEYGNTTFCCTCTYSCLHKSEFYIFTWGFSMKTAECMPQGMLALSFCVIPKILYKTCECMGLRTVCMCIIETSVASWRAQAEEASSQHHTRAPTTTSKLITELTWYKFHDKSCHHCLYTTFTAVMYWG